ncbi:hypothetical protein J8273_4749 [Carpediemonas membranifera]|uniref:Uncharacterized protein n=1 Tax=Carpediemonas membranifera TaxID=201153 RepID=A0A8J6AXD9_9EUKA|nr:hypothetical protein J8273_4749 [Carpediemonas membranifera]|eukprot:KAG9393885.1 hypothetical protein J8273_4749 [Carpediemonas membranifera]
MLTSLNLSSMGSALIAFLMSNGTPLWAVVLFPLIWLEFMQISMTYFVFQKKAKVLDMKRTIDNLRTAKDNIINSSDTFVQKSKIERQIIKFDKQLDELKKKTRKANTLAMLVTFIVGNVMQALLLAVLLFSVDPDSRAVFVFPATSTYVAVPAVVKRVFAYKCDTPITPETRLVVGLVAFFVLCKHTVGLALRFLRPPQMESGNGALAQAKALYKLYSMTRSMAKVKAE